MRRVYERFHPLRHKRLYRPLHYQVNELLMRVETAAVFSRVSVQRNHDLAIRPARRLALHKPLIDRPELLHGQIAVVHKPARAVHFGVAQVVYDRRDNGVGQPCRLQYRRGFGGEQPAVIRRQRDGRIPLVNEGEQRRQPVVISGCHAGERVALLHPPRDVVPPGLSQPIVVVARIIHRQQPSILSAQYEQQPV